MISKNKIKYLKSLHLKKNRILHKKFVVEGDKLVKECLKFAKNATSLWATEEWLNNNRQKIPAHIETSSVSDRELKSISQLKTPNQVLILMSVKHDDQTPIDQDQRFYLYLDGIRDPGNLGTILRTSQWFGFNKILCSPDCVELYNHKVIQATMGAFLHVELIQLEADQLKRKLPDHRIISTTMSGDNMYHATFDKKSILVIGNEGQGISSKLLRLSDNKISIPKATESNIDSLNAAVSAALVMAYIKNP